MPDSDVQLYVNSMARIRERINFIQTVEINKINIPSTAFKGEVIVPPVQEGFGGNRILNYCRKQGRLLRTPCQFFRALESEGNPRRIEKAEREFLSSCSSSTNISR
jgi:hypothetical protein